MPKINNKGVKALRREQAAERQKAYDALSIPEKIMLAASRPGNSDRELTRLGIQAGIYPATIAEDREAFAKLLHPAKGV